MKARLKPRTFTFTEVCTGAPVTVVAYTLEDAKRELFQNLPDHIFKVEEADEPQS